MNGLLTKKHQLLALKKASGKYPKLGIGYSYPTLIGYEKKGIVKPAKHQLKINNSDWRFYTVDEIEANVQRVINYKKQSIPAIK